MVAILKNSSTDESPGDKAPRRTISAITHPAPQTSTFSGITRADELLWRPIPRHVAVQGDVFGCPGPQRLCVVQRAHLQHARSGEQQILRSEVVVDDADIVR
jgi:hypothetical protein